VVKKKIEKDSTSTIKRIVIAKADSTLRAVRAISLVKYVVNMFTVKMNPAKKAAPRRDLTHCF
jgi:hypothetical protein